tara:strand:- start:742 stop:1275 length:534 start_codon:yes stop_codon:yes gene_type:complete
MRKSFLSLILIFSFFIYSQKSLAFDFAPEIGDLAPEFSLNGVNSKFKNKIKWDLKDFKGKWLILYFYPRDFTTGCTIEAKGFSDLKNKFSKYNAEIVGISADNEESHDSFCNSKSINYTLLSDSTGIVSEEYGSWIPPYSDRNTFLISPEGKIVYRWISVTPINHAKEVLKVLERNL